MTFGYQALVMLAIAASSMACSLVPAVPVTQGPFDGKWRSHGYGLGLEVTGAAVKAVEVTSVSRLAAWEASGRLDGNELVFMRNGCERRLIMVDADSLRLHATCSAADIVFDRIGEWPAAAYTTATADPEANYAVFWQTFAEIYPFFSLRDVDWQNTDRKFRPQVTSTTTPTQLFETVRAMIAPFHDAHTSIQAPSLKLAFRGSGTPSLSRDEFVRWASTVLPKYATGAIKPLCNERLWFGPVEKGVGYLLITAFSGLAGAGDHAAQAQALEAALDEIFRDSKELSGLIIDVRNNGGGYNGFGVAVAARLAASRYLAYSVKARERADGALRFTPPQSIWVEPPSRPGFRGKTVVLIGPGSVSAAETFAMSLMGRQPSVTFVGDRTQGVYSEIVGRALPNGWNISLPTEIYETADGRSFDRVGVAPAVFVPTLGAEDIAAGRDPALERAISLLVPSSGASQ